MVMSPARWPPSQLIDDPFAEPLVRAVGIDFHRWAAGNIKATDVDDPDGTWGL